MTRTPPKPSRRVAPALLVCLLCLLSLLGGPLAAGASGVAVQSSSNVSVTDTTLERSTVPAGGKAVVKVTVTNDGDARESYPVELTGNGRAYVQTLVALDAGETRTVIFRQTFERPGAYDLAVNGVPAGTLTVTGSEATSDTAETGTAATPSAIAGSEESDVSLQAWVLLVLVVGALGAGSVYSIRGRRFR